MLSEQIQSQINRELKKYPADQKQSAVMAALRFVQDEKGWIANEDMADIAAYLGMPKMAVYEVATFYHMYNLKPMGRHTITVCTNLSCTLCGAEETVAYLQGKLGIGLGGGEMKLRPGRIVFDPEDSSVFWVSGCYGDAPFKTEDGGKTFQRLGKLAHADGVAVDLADPARKTLLLGLHEQSQSLQLSRDGGNTWTKIGANLPADSNHSTDPIVIDSKTFLINTAGWKPQATLGIYRTEDGGR